MWGQGKIFIFTPQLTSWMEKMPEWHCRYKSKFLWHWGKILKSCGSEGRIGHWRNLLLLEHMGMRSQGMPHASIYFETNMDYPNTWSQSDARRWISVLFYVRHGRWKGVHTCINLCSFFLCLQLCEFWSNKEQLYAFIVATAGILKYIPFFKKRGS